MNPLLQCCICNTLVLERIHQMHWYILQALANADVPGGADLFVGLRKPKPANFDSEGRVAACDRCFVTELADNLLLAPLSE